MAEIPVQLRGTMYDLMSKSARQVFFDGVAWRSDVGVGGGPIYPPEGGDGKPPWQPPGHPAFPIWGGPGAGFPDKPGYPPVVGGGPIYPPNVPPDLQPPEPPAPGSPTTSVPGNWPVQPITPPPYIVVNYPGVGPVVVAPPEHTASK